jgi:hypothetical protein
MTVQEINDVKALAGSKIIKMMCDNGFILYSKGDNYDIIWDDTNQRLYQIRLNTNSFTQDKYPLELSVMPYMNIQNIIIPMDITDLIQLYEDHGVSAADINKKVNSFTISSKPAMITSDRGALKERQQ